MINLLVALALGGAVFALFAYALSPLEAILPAAAAALVAYYLLARRSLKMLERTFERAQRELLSGHIDKAVRILEGARPLARWQFLVNGQIDAQVGMIHFVRGDFKKAQPYLERAFSRLWIPKAMLGVIYFKKKDPERMRQNFEKAVAVGKKQGLAWGVYAWCEWKLGEIDRAIEVLSRGVKAMGDDDERLKANLLALQNGKKMKMRGYGEQWYQFHLEKMPAMKQQVRFARR